MPATDAEQAICDRIARFCGWRPNPRELPLRGLAASCRWIMPDGGFTSHVPDYFNDGNAMCEVLEALRSRGVYIEIAFGYSVNQWSARAAYTMPGDRQHADIPQRAVALAANEAILAMEEADGPAT